jgi:hypothetical protein
MCTIDREAEEEKTQNRVLSDENTNMCERVTRERERWKGGGNKGG